MPPSVFLRPARALEAFDMESNFGTGGLRLVRVPWTYLVEQQKCCSRHLLVRVRVYRGEMLLDEVLALVNVQLDPLN